MSYRVPIARAGQTCSICDRNKLKKEPIVRIDAYGWDKPKNICYKCIDAMNKDIKKKLRNKDVKADMLIEKMG